MAVVKADGFGHGAVDVARTSLAHGATRLGVTSIEEALALRAAGITAPVLSWLNPVDADFAAAVAADVELAVPGRAAPRGRRRPRRRAPASTSSSTPAWPATAPRPATWGDLCRAARMAERRGLVRVVGVMGHLANADTPADPANALGRTRFVWGLEMARSCGLRPGRPAPGRHLRDAHRPAEPPHDEPRRRRPGRHRPVAHHDPAARPHPDRAAGRRTPRPGAAPPVGYGHTWTAPGPTTLGLVPLGYADGLPRAASGRAEVLVRGRRRPLVGRISMDMAVVDLGAATAARPATWSPSSDPATTASRPSREWAGWADTIEHEIVTGLGARLPGPTARPRADGASDEDTGRRDRRRAEQRARRLPRLRGRDRRGARPGGVRRRRAHHRARRRGGAATASG